MKKANNGIKLLGIHQRETGTKAQDIIDKTIDQNTAKIKIVLK